MHEIEATAAVGSHLFQGGYIRRKRGGRKGVLSYLEQLILGLWRPGPYKLAASGEELAAALEEAAGMEDVSAEQNKESGRMRAEDSESGEDEDEDW